MASILRIPQTSPKQLQSLVCGLRLQISRGPFYAASQRALCLDEFEEVMLWQWRESRKRPSFNVCRLLGQLGDLPLGGMEGLPQTCLELIFQ